MMARYIPAARRFPRLLAFGPGRISLATPARAQPPDHVPSTVVTIAEHGTREAAK
jgi:hypothetical protein